MRGDRRKRKRTAAAMPTASSWATSAAVEVMRSGKDRVTAEQLWTMSKSKAKQFGNRRIPLEWWEIEQQISSRRGAIGRHCQQSDGAGRVGADQSVEHEVWHAKTAKLLYDANIKMVRGEWPRRCLPTRLQRKWIACSADDHVETATLRPLAFSVNLIRASLAVNAHMRGDKRCPQQLKNRRPFSTTRNALG